jgi:hypothetical protein
MELGEGILRSRSLMELDLNGMLGDDFLAIWSVGNSIGNEGARMIAEALLQLPQLVLSLDISGALLGHGILSVFADC